MLSQYNPSSTTFYPHISHNYNFCRQLTPPPQLSKWDKQHTQEDEGRIAPDTSPSPPHKMQPLS